MLKDCLEDWALYMQYTPKKKRKNKPPNGPYILF